MSARNEVAGPFVISRLFDAKRELLWQAWSDPERLSKWWGPKGFTVHSCKVDFRPGGIWHYSLRTSNGQEMWGRGLYREIVEPEKIVWVNSFSDPEGGIVKPPFSENWPTQMLTTLKLAEEGSGTKLTIMSEPIEATEEERYTFAVNHDSMKGGWTGTFNQLAEYLANTHH